MEQKLEKLKIYKQYPILKPFIGKNFEKANSQVLFVGESHYLPKEFIPGMEWYKNFLKDYDFTQDDKDYLNTRQIIERDVINSGHSYKSHSMYRNYGNVFGNVFELGDYNKALEHTAFYNYFLRPAETPGGSISPSWEEKLYAFEHLLNLYSVLNPDKIIFLSSKARQGFHQVFHSGEIGNIPSKFDSIIYETVHPTCSWWNRSMKKYNGRTGKEQLEYILNL